MTPKASDPPTTATLTNHDEQELAQLLRAVRCPFGPHFFMGQLAAFARDRCPAPEEHLPRVDIWVFGEPLAVCHIVAVSSSWVAVAVRDRHAHDAEMRTELIPYEAITRVTIGAPVARSRGIGFDSMHAPAIVEDAEPPARMLVIAAQPSADLVAAQAQRETPSASSGGSE
jgi:hypothetical protein